MDPKKVAQKNGIRILYDGVPPDIKGSAFRKGGQWYIMVNPYLSEEQQNFVVAHELAEIELDERDDLSLDQKHQQANIRAGEILLPEEFFKPLVHTCELMELKIRFPGCSYEVIARRSLMFLNRVLTIMDNGIQTARLASPEMQYPRMITAPEQQCIADCYRAKERCTRTYENLSMTAYYIDQGTNVIRVILFTEVTDMFV